MNDQKAIKALRFALHGALVDYDHAPGQLCDPELERLQMFNVQNVDSKEWTHTHYKLDEQAIDVLAQSSVPWWAEIHPTELAALRAIAVHFKKLYTCAYEDIGDEWLEQIDKDLDTLERYK